MNPRSRFKGQVNFVAHSIRLPPFACPNLLMDCLPRIECGIAEAVDRVIMGRAHRSEGEPWGRRMELRSWFRLRRVGILQTDGQNPLDGA